MAEGGRTPLLTVKELEEIGYNLVIFPTASVYTTTYAMLALMQEIKLHGTTAGVIDKMVPFAQFNELIGLPAIREIENKYLPLER